MSVDLDGTAFRYHLTAISTHENIRFLLGISVKFSYSAEGADGPAGVDVLQLANEDIEDIFHKFILYILTDYENPE